MTAVIFGPFDVSRNLDKIIAQITVCVLGQKLSGIFTKVEEIFLTIKFTEKSTSLEKGKGEFWLGRKNSYK